jgi:hypothetical protein
VCPAISQYKEPSGVSGSPTTTSKISIDYDLILRHFQGPSYTKSKLVYFTQGPKLVRSQFDLVISIKSPLKVLGGYSYSNLLPFLLFARHLDRDKDIRDEDCGEEVRGPPLRHTGENK